MTNKKITPLASILAMSCFVVGLSACEQSKLFNPLCDANGTRALKRRFLRLCSTREL